MQVIEIEEAVARVPIRYDGKDAANHKIELAALGESLAGVARILGVVGHFVATLEYAKQYQSHDIRVMVEEPKANCYSIVAVLEWAKEYQLLSGAATAAIGAIVAWLFNRAAGRQEEMKHLKSALDNAIQELGRSNQATVDRALLTVEKMADALVPSVRQAVTPVGKTCSAMTIAGSATVDEATADAIRNPTVDEVTSEREWLVTLTELDIITYSAKVCLEAPNEDTPRVKAKITDPATEIRPNLYTQALNSGMPIIAKGKATMRNGTIMTIYISDARLAD